MKEIIALNNSQKKLIKSLHSKKYRQENKLFLSEGLKICKELFENKLSQTEMIVIPNDAKPQELNLANEFLKNNIPVFKTQQSIFNQICEAKSPQGILGIVKINEQNIFTDKPFIALDNISDPGNVGTIIRTADWFGFKQILLSRHSADIYNSKTVRSTMGSIFRVNIIQTKNLKDFISNNFQNHKIFAAVLNSKYYLEDLPKENNFGLILGNESKGISDDLINIIDRSYSIRGYGKTESLNVSIAAAISMYYFRSN